MTYSFLLGNFNMWGLVERCIADIESHIGRGEEYEILIADNSDDERFGAPDEFRGANSAVRVVPVPPSRGWVDALNHILPMAGGRFVVIMHPDVTLAQGCLGELRGFLERHPRAGVVSPALVYPDGSPNAIRLRFPKVTVELQRLVNIICHILLKRRPLAGEELWDHKQDVQADMVMSVLMMFRAQALKQIGPIEPRLWMYYANDWLCGRARQLGWTCHYVAAARATHWERYSPPGLYSNTATSAYKRDAMPVSDRLCRDRIRFLRAFYSLPACMAFRLLVTMEYFVHLLAQLKPGRGRRRESMRKCAATIKAAWA